MMLFRRSEPREEKLKEPFQKEVCVLNRKDQTDKFMAQLVSYDSEQDFASE